MNNIAKIVLLGGTALAGIVALVLGNGMGGGNNLPNDPSIYNNQTSNTNTTNLNPAPKDDLPKSTLKYLPTQFLGDQLVHHNYYSLSYSKAHKNAEWVAYELRGSRLYLDNAIPRGEFIPDPDMQHDANARDYLGSGYDRGHLAPVFDMNFNRVAMKECGYMSNICPQVPEFNRGIWKELESKTRKWAKRYKRVYVVTGPILRHNVAEATHLKDNKNMPTIPRGYYKVILDYDGKEKKGIGFLFKNKDIDQPLGNFVVSIDRVEAYTGLDFFPELSEQEAAQLEAIVSPKQWGF